MSKIALQKRLHHGIQTESPEPTAEGERRKFAAIETGNNIEHVLVTKRLQPTDPVTNCTYSLNKNIFDRYTFAVVVVDSQYFENTD